MRLFITMLLLCCIPISNVFSQEPEPKEYPEQAQVPGKSSVSSEELDIPDLTWTMNNALLSSEARAMTNRINAGPDKYTGTLQVNVPLYEMRTSGGVIPIALNYNGSGIKISDFSQITGIGWDLSAGGKITRAIKSKADNFTMLRDVNDIKKWNTKFIWDHQDDNSWDTEPDVYFFEFPGMSGRFVLDGDCIAHTFPYLPVKIEYDSLANLFTIYDPQQGARYLFKDYATSSSRIVQGYFSQYAGETDSSWYLNEIKYPDGATVTFSYTKSNYYYTIYEGEIGIAKDGSTVKYINGWSVDCERRIDIDSYQLTSIQYNEQEIKFLYDDHKTGNASNTILNSFEVYANKQKLKTFSFVCDTFPNGNLRLKQVYIKAKPGHKRPIASFTYYEDPIMPGHTHRGFDHWGYWNQDGENLSGCPDTEIEGISTSDFASTRIPDFERTRAQSLKSIVYPSGGSKEFIYELHRGKLQHKDMMMICGGLRIQKIIERDGINNKPSEYSYTYDGGVVYADRFNYVIKNYGTYHYFVSPRCLSSIMDFLGSSVVYSSVTEHLPNGSYVKYDYTPFDECKDIYPEKYKVLDETVEYLGFETSEDMPKTIRAWCRNLLQQETAYDANGKIVKRTKFEYLIDSTACDSIPGHVVYRSHIGDHTYTCIARYYRICCPVLLKRKIEYAGKTTIYCCTDYKYNKRHLRSRTVERFADGTRITSFTKYLFEYFDKINFEKGYPSEDLIPIENVVYKNGKVIDASLHIFSHNPLHLSKSLKLKEPDALIDSMDFTISSRSIRGTMQYDNRYEETVCYDYDSAGNLISYQKNGEPIKSFLFSRGQSIPMATVINARYAPEATERINEVYFNDFEAVTDGEYVWPESTVAKSGTHICSSRWLMIPLSNFKQGRYILSYWWRTNSSQQWNRYRSIINVTESTQNLMVPFPAQTVMVDDLSIVPQNATIQSSVILPGLGKISETDIRGRTTYYEYNGFGLPIRVLNNEREVIKTFSYDNYNPNITIPAL